MSLSIFLTIYFLFLVVYGALMGFAVYKVFLFAKNKDLKGYSRRITLVFLIFILSVVFISFLFIPRYNWNDNLGFYCKVFSKSCICETNIEKKKECEENKKKEKEAETVKQSDQADKNSSNQDLGNTSRIRPSYYFFID